MERGHSREVKSDVLSREGVRSSTGWVQNILKGGLTHSLRRMIDILACAEENFQGGMTPSKDDHLSGRVQCTRV